MLLLSALGRGTRFGIRAPLKSQQLTPHSTAQAPPARSVKTRSRASTLEGRPPCRLIFVGQSAAPVGSASLRRCLGNNSPRLINAMSHEEKNATQDLRKKPQRRFRWRRRDYSIQFRKLKLAEIIATTTNAVVRTPPATATAVDTRMRRMIGS